MNISVSLAYNIFEPLTYRAAETPGLQPGSRVLVPLGRRIALGWVMGLESPYRGRLKDIIGVIDDPFRPDDALLEFARLAAATYFTSAGIVLDHSLPPSQKNPKNLRLGPGGDGRKLADFAPGELERLAASGPLRFVFKSPTEAAPDRPAAGAGRASRRWLLQPGREQEYREACERTLAEGRSVILVVPDNATARYWQSVMPGIDLFHSEVRTAEREKAWRRYRAGKCGVVCGGIAALSLPLADPGLLIVDRAASPLYRRSPGSPFHLDHLAGLRARCAGIPILYGSLSHTCASYAQQPDPGLDDRRPEPRPAFQLQALKGRERGIPAALLDLLRQNFLAGKRTLVLVNRIQPALHLFCEPCGRIAACPRCGAPLGRLQPGGLPAPLQADGGQRMACQRCAFRSDSLRGCPRCGRPLEPLHDISIESLALAVQRISGEAAVLSLTAAELKDPETALDAARARPVVIATLAALNPCFQGLFAAAVWVKPESFFNMEEFDAAEMIHACGAEIAATLAPGGELHVFSVFHFHYALQTLMDEASFFERELKYRQWFELPPFASVYELELRDAGLRSLGAAMRDLYGRQRDALHIRRVYLASRQPERGTFRGVLELHAGAEAIAAAGLHCIRRSVLRRIAGQ